ncbi:MAG: hypothetical protein KBD15_03000 [Candidatus Magasanikbacteria bacterium]|nr:hypothetical protein [Candidatus Magasanikbacteria bacterium]
MTYIPLQHQHTVAVHNGVFKKQLSLAQAVALIVSSTIGAGVLGIPYAVAKVGLIPGIIYILVLGFLMTGFHLLLGSICANTGEKMHLAGLAERYLGQWGKKLMTVLFYSMLFGALVIYLIGIGQSLAAVFGGNAQHWSLIFFVLATILLFIGIHAIKSIELLLTLGIFAIVVCITAWSIPYATFEAWKQVSWVSLFFPYGIILFALHGSNSIPEAYTLLKEKKPHIFRQAIIISGLLITLVYIIFTTIVVGVTGNETTEIATIGLGRTVGNNMHIFGNLFALIALATSYIAVGLSLSDSLFWDYKMPRLWSRLLVSFIPLAIFAFGITSFIQAIDIVGGIFVSLEMLLILAIYRKMIKQKKQGTLRLLLKHSTGLFCVVLLALCVGAVYSIITLF